MALAVSRLRAAIEPAATTPIILWTRSGTDCPRHAEPAGL